MNRNNEQNASFQKLLENGPVTNLRVNRDHYILEIVKGSEPRDHTSIEAGNIHDILKNLQHEPSEALDLEAAIAAIEDKLMPIINDLPEHRSLVTDELAFWELAKIAEESTGDIVQLGVNTVEEIFNRLVDVAYGTPASRLNVPENREFAGIVLFLRELMHHANYSSLTIC